MLIKVIVQEIVGYNGIDVDSRMYDVNMEPIMHNDRHLGQISSSLGWAMQDISYKRYGKELDELFPGASSEFEFSFEFRQLPEKFKV